MAVNYTVAFLWGLCEAVFFFIVPDVWLTWLVVRNKENKQLLMAGSFATFGALLGGLLLYVLASVISYDQLIEYLKHVPGIHQRQVDMVAQQISEIGVSSFIVGSFSGVPYKIYAVEWNHMNMSLFLFIGITILARALRFLAAVCLARILCAIGRRILKGWEIYKKVIFLSVWVIFYIVYFSQHLS